MCESFQFVIILLVLSPHSTPKLYVPIEVNGKVISSLGLFGDDISLVSHVLLNVEKQLIKWIKEKTKKTETFVFLNGYSQTITTVKTFTHCILYNIVCNFI